MLEFWNNIPFPMILFMRIATTIFILFIVGPIALKAVFLYRIPTDILILDPHEETFPSSVRHFLDEQFEQLSGLGFELKESFALPKLVANAASINAMFVNERTRDSALVSMLWTHSSKVKIKRNYVEIVRRFSNGSMLQTNNSSRVGSFVSPPDHLTLQLPQVQNLRELHRIHIRACEAFGSGRWAQKVSGVIVCWLMDSWPSTRAKR